MPCMGMSFQHEVNPNGRFVWRCRECGGKFRPQWASVVQLTETRVDGPVVSQTHTFYQTASDQMTMLMDLPRQAPPIEAPDILPYVITKDFLDNLPKFDLPEREVMRLGMSGR
jgi:hypothetical protein